MSKFHVKLSARAKDMGNNVAMFDAMYADREKLETIFRFFDTDGNGCISREEFHRVSYLLQAVWFVLCLLFRGEIETIFQFPLSVLSIKLVGCVFLLLYERRQDISCMICFIVS